MRICNIAAGSLGPIGFSVGAMSAVHTVTAVSVSVSVRTSLMAPTNVSFNAARFSEKSKPRNSENTDNFQHGRRIQLFRTSTVMNALVHAYTGDKIDFDFLSPVESTK